MQERPFRELTVDEVMRRTGLSRPSFYVYFKDRHDLVLRVVQHLQGEIFGVTDTWFSGEGPGQMRLALRGATEVYARHAAVLRALADAAADDPDVEAAYAHLVQFFVDRTVEQIEEELGSGRITIAIDAAQVGKALVWLAERYLYLSFAPDSHATVDQVTSTLQLIWTRSVYGAD